MNKRFITITCIDCKLTEDNRYCTTKRCYSCQKKNRTAKGNALNKLPKNKERIESWYRYKRYGITKEEELAILKRQQYRCPICAEEVRFREKRSHIDHDHITNKVRGVLCFRCNVGLGSFQDKIESLQNAIDYLKRSCE